jgi:MFS family permease
MKKISRNEYLLLFGRWTSKIGDIVFDYVNNVVLVQAFTNSSWVLAFYQSSQTIINILFNLIGGVIADSGKRKKILIIADLFSAFICFITSFFVDSKFVAVALVTANALLALIFSFSSPTFKSIVREMVEKDRISRYNSISNGGKELIGMVGPVIGLALMNFVGARGSLLINAATFFFSAISECLLVRLEQEKRTEVTEKKRNVIFDIKEGFRYLWRERTIFYLLVISSFVNFFLAGYNLLIPYTDVIYKDIFNGFYSKVLVAEAIGGIVGSFVNSKIPSEITKKHHVLLLFLGATGVTLVLPPIASLTKNLIVCLIPFVLFGAMLTVFNINYMSYVQISVDEEYLGRVFSVIFTIAVIFMPIGSFVFSFFHITNSMKGFSLIGIGIIVLTLFSLFFSKKSGDNQIC